VKAQNSEEDILAHEVTFSKKVEHSYTSWLSDYFAKERLNSFNNFCDPLLNKEYLDTLRNRQLSLDKIESDMLTYIETGRLASMTLAKMHEQE